MIALDAVPHRDRMKAEHPRQHIRGLLVTDWDVYPDNGVRTFKQLWELFDLMSLDTCLADKPDIHTFTAPSASRGDHRRSIQLRAKRRRPGLNNILTAASSRLPRRGSASTTSRHLTNQPDGL